MVNFVVGLLLFTPLPGWDAMVAFLTSLMALSYAMGPVCLIALRHQLPQQHRPLKLAYGTTWGYLAFFICNCLAYWTGWSNISKLFIAIIISLIVLFLYRLCSTSARDRPLNISSAGWLLPYIIGLSIISYLGTFGNGIGLLPFGWDLAVLFVFSMIIMRLAIAGRLPDETTQQAIHALQLPPTYDIKGTSWQNNAIPSPCLKS
jgi:amino acid transporter